MKRIDQLNRNDIEYHLRSAVDSLVPDILGQVDLNTPQEEKKPAGTLVFIRRLTRHAAAACAACLCVLALSGGAWVYRAHRVDSVIGIDVNPSIELSVNSKNRVLEAEALNGDAEIILDDMELENVDLNVALNAVIGSMVQKGYLDDLDNAILVTVANDDAQKAADIREMVVGDIETSLRENQVQAVVYNQRAVTTDEVEAIAGEYGISYGKAYFLKELIDQNEGLDDADMEKFAAMTMEEIAREIADASYDLGEDMNQPVDVTLAPTEEETEATAPPETTAAPETQTETAPPSETESTAAETTVPVLPTVPETSTAQEETQSSEELNIKIDYVDFEDGILDIVFKSKVKWKNATISVYDGNGDSYSAHIIDTGSTSCSVQVSGLPGDEECTFVIGGVALKSSGNFGTVKGYFDTPYISEDAQPTQEPSETESSTSAPESTQEPSETETETETQEEPSKTESEEESKEESSPDASTEPIEEEETAAGNGQVDS